MISVQISLSDNKLIGEKIAQARIVNMQTMEFDEFCEYLAEGASVTAADVAAVMKRLEKLVPMLMALNIRIMASPNGIVFQPTVSGSLTQKQLKEKLQEKLKADPTADIDVDRDLLAGDLTVNDLTAGMNVVLPKKMLADFAQEVIFKRVTRATTPSDGGNEEDDPNDNPNPNPDGGGGGGNTGDTPPPITG